MSLHWYTCISTNTCHFEMHHISLETNWWALPNASLIVRIRSAVHEILADKAFTATDVLISQSFVVAFVHPIYVRIAFIWGFPTQLSLWKLVHWLWKYKLNEVCDKEVYRTISSSSRARLLTFVFSFLLTKLKENWSEKLSIMWLPRESSILIGEKDRKIPWDLLYELVRWSLVRVFWWLVSEPILCGFDVVDDGGKSSMRLLRMWLIGSLKG